MLEEIFDLEDDRDLIPTWKEIDKIVEKEENKMEKILVVKIVVDYEDALNLQILGELFPHSLIETSQIEQEEKDLNWKIFVETAKNRIQRFVNFFGSVVI